MFKLSRRDEEVRLHSLGHRCSPPFIHVCKEQLWLSNAYVARLWSFVQRQTNFVEGITGGYSDSGLAIANQTFAQTQDQS